jgi:hypothetical protein
MITVAIMTLNLEYLVKILDWGRSRSRYIFTDSNFASDSNSDSDSDSDST